MDFKLRTTAPGIHIIDGHTKHTSSVTYLKYKRKTKGNHQKMPNRDKVTRKDSHISEGKYTI